MSKVSEFLKIMPEIKKESPAWVKRLFIVSFLPIFIVAVVFAVLIGQEAGLSNKKQAIIAEILAIESNSNNKTVLQEMQGTAQSINAFSYIFANHVYGSHCFDFLRQICQKQVQFDNFSLNVEKGEIIIAAIADNFEALGEQVLILNQTKEILSSSISGINLNKEGKVEFDIALVVEPAVFSKNFYKENE